MAKELYVGHISEQATEEDLRKLFQVMGVVTSVHLIVDQETGEFKRCGYVRMLSEVNLDEVVETLDGAWLVDRCIVVSVAKPQKERQPKKLFHKRRANITDSSATSMGSSRPASVKTPKSGILASGVRKSTPAATLDGGNRSSPSGNSRRSDRKTTPPDRPVKSSGGRRRK